MTTPTDSPAELRSVAETLAGEAARFVRRRRAEVFGGHHLDGTTVQAKSSPTDPVTVVDTDTERLLRERLADLRPGDSVLGEEGGLAGTDSGGVTWVLDPIDGTVNFVYGVPAYGVSVAARIGGVSVAGAVADVVGGQVYSAAAGLGAQVADEHGTAPLRCNGIEDLSMALLGTGFGYSARRRAVQAQLLAHLLPVVRDVRRIGSAALDLCMVAAGRLDAFYEHGLKVWDYAAGSLIAAEAGARVRIPEAEDPARAAGLIAVAAPGIAEEFIGVLDRFDGLAPIPE